MDAASLRALARPALQKLAKENGVKANLKSDIIIELLLARQEKKSPSPESAENKTSSASLPPPLNRTAEEVVELPAAALPSPAPNHSTDSIATDRGPATINAGDDHQNDLVNGVPQADVAPDLENMALQYPSSPAYTFGTPESSMPGTPEPEAPAEVLEDVVRTMALIDEKDQKTLGRIAALRGLAFKLRGKAEALRTAIRSERARRQRIENYVAYWRTTHPEWSFEDVWEGQIRVYRTEEFEFEVTSTDDERMEEENQQFQAEARKAGMIPPAEPRRVASNIIATLPNGAGITPSADPLNVQRAGVSPPVCSPPRVQQNGKRRRDDDKEASEEQARYQHRTRSEEAEAHLPSQSGVLEHLTELPRGLINGGAIEISMQPVAAADKKKGKRRRENAENVDDSVRHRSRPRLAAHSASGDFKLASPRAQAHVDKGKAKMTPAQVEELLRESHGQWELHAQNEPEPSQAMATDLRVVQQKRDRALAMAVQNEEYSGLPVAAKPTTISSASSPPKPTRRSIRAASKRTGR
ncbi:hypothetical protein LshimejAT787_0407870 [Lyophyllum shimeji]|uniref:Uncharacterized protein n=1 Tax=Lyophyllum shimeji TaxID=47721 RepID=A0A9P3UNY1_LYOSH|nr:hypothetical protein LshimejAT787_0407870 [Lyophyllum shimeji]